MRALLVPLLLVLSFLAAGACSRDQQGPAPAAPEPALRIAVVEPATLDPAFMVGRNDANLVVNLLEGLFVPGPTANEPTLGVAESYFCDSDGLRCTFKLRRSARWSDGAAVTAEDFIFAWTRVADPATGSPGADTMTLIQGMEECVKGEPCSPGLEAPDPGTLVIRLVRPDPFLNYKLSHPRFSPVPRHVLARVGRDWATPEGFVGNGPYLPGTWRPGVELELRASETYGVAPGVFESVILKFTSSEDTAMRWFLAGEVDVVDGLVPLERMGELEARKPGCVASGPVASIFYLAPNLRSGPLADPAVRRLWYSAIDRDMLVQGILGNGQVPAYSLVPAVVAELSGYRPASCPRIPPRELARPGTSSGPAQELLYNQGATMTRMMEFIQQNLAEKASITVGLRVLEWKSFLDEVRAGNFQVARYGLTGEPDPMDFLGALVSSSPNNIGGYSSLEFDDLINRARVQADPRVRNQLLAEAEALLCRDVAVIPIYSSVAAILREPGLYGYEANVSSIHRFDAVAR